MSDQSSRWQEVASRADALALKLQLHMEQQQAADDAGGETALDRFRVAMDDAFTAAGNAVRDDAVRADLREMGQLMIDAITAAVDEVGAEARERLDRR
ncbi:MAG TPA: hypothetical protein VFH03_09670 [Actinoplanes sp.]|nr:hypothetical protein [Actinoplanes sp.]